jgi:hypothetical protein
MNFRNRKKSLIVRTLETGRKASTNTLDTIMYIYYVYITMSCMQRKVKFTYKDAKAEEVLVEFLIGCH